MTWLTTGEEVLVRPPIAVASGKRSKSDLSGVGEEECAPWITAR
jgi:hypothetical protein